MRSLFIRIKRILFTNKKANFVFLLVCLLLVNVLSIGYSALNKSLTISGDAVYEAVSNKLYDLLKTDVSTGLVREYTGEHQDDVNGNGTKTIYHYYASSDANATTINEKNNVIFAGHCW